MTRTHRRTTDERLYQGSVAPTQTPGKDQTLKEWSPPATGAEHDELEVQPPDVRPGTGDAQQSA